MSNQLNSYVQGSHAVTFSSSGPTMNSLQCTLFVATTPIEPILVYVSNYFSMCKIVAVLAFAHCSAITATPSGP